MKRTLYLYNKLQKYLVDTLTLSSVTANDTWQKKIEYLCSTVYSWYGVYLWLLNITIIYSNSNYI